MTRAILVAETLEVSRHEVIGQIGRVMSAAERPFMIGGGVVLNSPCTYPAILLDVQDGVEDLQAAMTVDGDVHAALASLASRAVFAMTALAKQQYNGRL